MSDSTHPARPAPGERILFMGDSITECCRDRVEPPLGGGYVQLVHCFFKARHPELELHFINRGIDGETILDLERRWQRDVIEEHPDHLFLMIGVNDILYRVVDPPRAVQDEQYEATLRRLVDTTREQLGCRITLMDPTPLEEDPTAASHEQVARLAAIVARVAQERDLGHIPCFQSLLRLIRAAPGRGWMIDVPHPNLAGQSRIALDVLAWLGW